MSKYGNLLKAGPTIFPAAHYIDYILFFGDLSPQANTRLIDTVDDISRQTSLHRKVITADFL